jgi:hypothetical protein
MKMKTRPSRRQKAKVSHARWIAYATAGAATALTASHSAEAGIHYQVVNKKFQPNSNKEKWFQLDQPGDSIYFKHDLLSLSAAFNIRGIATAAFRGLPGTSKYSSAFVSKLSFGESIAAGHFTHDGGILADEGYGQWTSPGMGFVGFTFNNGAGIQYGWARVRMGVPPHDGIGGWGFKVLDFAYADPRERITAGEGIPGGGEYDQDINDDPGPYEGSLGGLVLGAVGLLAWRKSRSRTARLEGI